jgi:hypothetical protein
VDDDSQVFFGEVFPIDNVEAGAWFSNAKADTELKKISQFDLSSTPELPLVSADRNTLLVI